jgi:hypothetical protein
MTNKPQKRSRHGLHRLMVAVKAQDLRALDKRCAGAKALMQWKAELISDLGGEANLSSQKRVLVDAAVRSKLFLDSLDGWLLQQRSLVNARKKSILPALGQRQTLVDGLVRILSLLGLDRVQKDVLNAERLAEVESVLAERDPSLLPAGTPKEETSA